MKMRYSEKVKNEMLHRKPRKKIKITKDFLESVGIVGLWSFGFLILLYIGFTM